MCPDKEIHDLSQQRLEYDVESVDEGSMAADPFKQFELWYQSAVTGGLVEPNAMVLATVSADGQPTQRTVLLKYFDVHGFVFFTSYESRKATQIANNRKVSLLFQWLTLQRQLEINGRAERVSAAESLKYFATRPRGSQLGAWVSQQSTVISSRSLLETKLAELKRKFASGLIPLPLSWGGFRVVPHRFEFWQGRPNRLHDRLEYLKENELGWKLGRLSP
jgi:pyridoxamine 5'-phosphate oxidase